MLLIFAGASGVGKDTIAEEVARQLRQEYNNDYVAKAVSWTTRDMGNGEIEGFDFYFIPKSDSIGKLTGLIEKSSAYDFHRGNFYGTVESEFKKAPVTWCVMSKKGVEDLVAKFGYTQTFTVFVSAPKDSLYDRMVLRGRDSLANIDAKMLHIHRERELEVDDEIRWDMKVFNGGSQADIGDHAHMIIKHLKEKRETQWKR